jgi:uncharacterized protein (TIGR03437 family)
LVAERASYLDLFDTGNQLTLLTIVNQDILICMSPIWKSCNPVLHILFALVVSATLVQTAMAQFAQEGDKLVGTAVVGPAGQGSSVALSADGNTAIVGGFNDNSGVGAIWVYTRTSGVWSQQGGKLVGTGAVGNAHQGGSVALSGDGNTAIVGGVADNFYAGGAWVYTRTSGVWSQQGGKLVGTGAVGKAYQGSSVALSGDGNTAIVGGPSDATVVGSLSTANGSTGAAWVFTRSGGIWNQQGSKLVGTGAVGMATQGTSVALSGDGNTAAVAGPTDATVSGRLMNNGSAGATWVYTRSGGVWSQQGSKLAGAVGKAQGYSVTLSGDGNTAAVVGQGAEWVYTRSGGAWSQQVISLVDNGIPMTVCCVALSANGDSTMVGGSVDNHFNGAAWVYTRVGGGWTQQGSKLVGTGVVYGAGGAMQGSSVALSADGSTAISGGPTDNGNAGAAWVFVIPGPSIASSGVVNGANFLPGIAPGTWITIQGSQLSAATRTWTGADFSGSNLPTQLDGVSVTVAGKPAYVYFISPTQLNVLTPEDATQGAVPVQVTTTQGKSNVVNAVEGGLPPALFTFSQQGGRYVAAVRADGTFMAPPNLISGAATVPAKAGDTILLFGTGFGPTTPPSPIGQLVNVAPLANQVTVRIGGVAADTQFAGIVSPGLYQFNVVVPNVPAGDNVVSIAIGNSSSQPSAFLAIQR